MDEHIVGEQSEDTSVSVSPHRPLAQYEGDAQPILERLRCGERAQAIAKAFGISHQALYAFLLRHHADEWRAISASKALARAEQAEIDIDAAEDNVSITKARESHRIAAWTLERMARPLYGDVKGEGGVTVQVLVQRDGVTIEGGNA